MRVICPVCGREIGAYVPRGGDGTALRPFGHQDIAAGRLCEGRFYDVDAADVLR